MDDKIKSYQDWMPVKAKINSAGQRLNYKEGDIYWVSIGENVGFEEDGKGILFARPVLVVKGFSKELFWGVPLTSQNKAGKYYVELGVFKRKSVAILTQLRAFDTLRISGKKLLGRVDKNTLKSIKNKLSKLAQS